MRLSAIAAVGEKNELGFHNKLLWDIPEDLRRFQKITTGHPIIMGRNTYESIGRVLPKRTNIIVTNNIHLIIPNGFVVQSITDAIKSAAAVEYEESFIIGGAQIFSQIMSRIQRLYLTVVHQTYPCADAFFPDFSQFNNIISKQVGISGSISYTFLILERKI